MHWRTLANRALLLYAAPTLLVVVASIQFYLASVHHLNPIKGGGFGMFAGHNTNVLRTITMSVLASDGRRIRAPLPLTDSYGKLFGELKVMPLRARVKNLAAQLAQEPWVEVIAAQSVALIEEYIQDRSKSLSYPTEPLTITEIEIVFWQYDFDSAQGKLSRNVLLRESAAASSSRKEEIGI